MDTYLQPHSTVRVLVVDDHPSTAKTLARAIAQLGPQVDVTHATSGKEALEQASADSVDVLITDMMMPGMNGLELIDKMQSNPGGRPAHIILVTAYDVPGLRETARRLQVNETILKPVHPEHICQIVSNIISSMGPAPVVVEPEVPKQPFKILIADDVPDNVTLLSRYMHNEGYSFTTSATGTETLLKVRTELPDLVLLDVNMPDKDGFAVLAEMRSDPVLEHIPVIILTAARLHPNDVQAGLNLGADDYVTKPFDRRELLARIRAKLRAKSFEDAIRRHNRQLSILPEIGKELSARLDLDELSNVVLRHTVETLGALAGHVILVDPRHVLQKSHRADSHHGPVVECPRMDGFLDELNESHAGLIVNDVTGEPRWQSHVEDPTRSAVIVPMFGRDHLLGLLVLAHERVGYFQTDHLLLLQAITSQAAIAMENALLYEDLSHQQRRLSVVLESAAEAIFLFDVESRLRLVNPAGEKLFTDFNSNLNQPLARGQYDALINLLEQARLSGGLKTGEIQWPDGRTFDALITPIEGGSLVAVLHDVTYFKQVEQVKNEFIAVASHDLKNPIMSISGYSDLLIKAGPLTDLQSGFVHRIQNAAKSMSELVQDMLQLARADMNAEQKNESVEMSSLLVEIVDEFKDQASIRKQTLDFIPLLQLTHVEGDPLQLRQLLRNLVSNAIKYTPDGGSIQVDARVADGSLTVGVQDNGFGIPAADLPFIFDRFYRAHTDSGVEGNGLGLSIVKSIAERHGGAVSVRSEPGKGSRFTVILPVESIFQKTI